MLTNRQFTLMGAATNHLRCQGEKAFLSFVESNMVHIDDRLQSHLADKTTYSLVNNENRKKVLFEYAIGEVYFELMTPDAQQGIRDTAAIMQGKMRDWFRGGLLIGGIIASIVIGLIGQLTRAKCQ